MAAGTSEINPQGLAFPPGNTVFLPKYVLSFSAPLFPHF